MSVGINPSKAYTHPVMGEALGKWAPLLTSAGNFYWHVKATSPAAFEALASRYAALQAKRKAGEYLQPELSGGAREALANVLLTLAPPANAAVWLQQQLDAYAANGAIFRGADPRFALSDWTVSSGAKPGGSLPGVEPGAPERSGIGATEIGAGLLLLAGLLWAKNR